MLYLVESLGFEVAFVLHLSTILSVGIHATLIIVDNLIAPKNPIVLTDIYGIVKHFVVKIP